MAKQITNRCPHAKNCWRGGGSYKCTTSPPFCKKPLLPKNSDDWKKLELPRMGKEPEENKGGDFVEVSATIQGELF